MSVQEIVSEHLTSKKFCFKILTLAFYRNLHIVHVSCKHTMQNIGPDSFAWKLQKKITTTTISYNLYK